VGQANCPEIHPTEPVKACHLDRSVAQWRDLRLLLPLLVLLLNNIKLVISTEAKRFLRSAVERPAVAFAFACFISNQLKTCHLDRSEALFA
jgi:hypothetical protein